MHYARSLQWAAVLSLAPTVGCEQKHATTEPVASAAATGSLQRGERVVVEETAAHFYEARVLEVSADDVRVEPIGGAASKRIALAEAYPVTRACERCERGSLAICRVDAGTWTACRIEEHRGVMRRVSTADGRSIELDRTSVLAPSPFTELNLERHFEKMRAQREFSQLAARQHEPRAPKGWRASPRGRVVAKLGERWLSATVKEIEEKSLHLVFVGSERSVELEARWVVPEPPHGSATPRGSFVLLRPAQPAGEWQRWRVASVDARRDGADLVVVNAVGTSRHCTHADVIPLPRAD